MSNTRQLRKSILSVLAFYDMFSYPLTAGEILNLLELDTSYLGRPGIEDIMYALENDEVLKRICIKEGGYYCFCEKRENVQIRHERYIIADQKFKKVQWFIYLLSLVPYIRLICVCNSLSYENTHKDSDIDLFIVTEREKVHLSRMIAVALAALFGLRPKEESHADKICLSFFVDKENMDIANLRFGDDDVYFRYWFLELSPIYDAGGVFDEFLEKNKWICRKYCFHQPKKMYERAIFHGKKIKVCKKILEWIASAVLRSKIEQFLLAQEEKHFPNLIQQMRNKDTRVVINKGVLKFHPNDRRQEYAQRLQKRMTELKGYL